MTPLYNIQHPKVSIIIPVFNKIEYIKDCIHSCLKQTYKNIEIIVVDDCSSDSSGLYAKTLLADSSIENFVLQHATNKGLSASRNSGIRQSKGDYLFFLDADDTIDNNLISELVKHLAIDKKNPNIPFAKIQRFSNISELNISSENSSIQYGCSWKLCKINHFYYACGSLLSKKILTEYNIEFREDIRKHEDILFLAEYLSHVSNGVFITSHYNYRSTPGSLTHNCSINDRVKILQEVYLLLNKSIIQNHAAIITFYRILKNGIFLSKDCDNLKHFINTFQRIKISQIIHSQLPFTNKIIEIILSNTYIEWLSYGFLRYFFKV